MERDEGVNDSKSGTRERFNDVGTDILNEQDQETEDLFLWNFFNVIHFFNVILFLCFCFCVVFL